MLESNNVLSLSKTWATTDCVYPCIVLYSVKGKSAQICHPNVWKMELKWWEWLARILKYKHWDFRVLYYKKGSIKQKFSKLLNCICSTPRDIKELWHMAYTMISLISWNVLKNNQQDCVPSIPSIWIVKLSRKAVRPIEGLRYCKENGTAKEH